MEEVSPFELKKAKVWLYKLLLEKGRGDPGNLTDTEIEIAYHLATDQQIQEVLDVGLQRSSTEEAK